MWWKSLTKKLSYNPSKIIVCWQVGSSHTGLDYGVQAVTPMQTDRIPWAFGPPEVTADETRQQGSIPMLSGHMASISSVRQAGPSPVLSIHGPSNYQRPQFSFIKNDTPDIDISSFARRAVGTRNGEGIA